MSGLTILRLTGSVSDLRLPFVSELALCETKMFWVQIDCRISNFRLKRQRVGVTLEHGKARRQIDTGTMPPKQTDRHTQRGWDE